MHLYMFIIIAFLAYLGISIVVKNKFDIKGNGLFYSHINKIHKIGELSIGLLVILVLGIRTFFYNIPLEPHHFISAIILLQVFRAFIEWKFDKSSKKYTLSTLTAIFLLIIFLGIELFFSW